MKKLVLAQKSQNITNAIQKAAIETQKSQREIEKERRKELMSNLLGEWVVLTYFVPNLPLIA